jgi:flagellar M-ring protein FliF
MDVLNALRTQVKQIWEGLTPGQRTTGMLLVGLMVAALAATALWSGNPEYVRLFETPLEGPEQVGNILKALKAANIPARQEKGLILVPAASYDKAFIELNGKAAWPQDQTTSDMKGLVDDWRLSDPGRRERARLSLQARLGRMVTLMEGVQSATVLLAEGNNGIFSGERYEPKATVQVALRAQVEGLSSGVAETIRRMVAFGVQGIKPETVAVVDNQGKIYEERKTDDDQAVMSTFEKMRRDREADIVGKVRNALAPIAGAKIAVSAGVILNQDKVRERAVSVDPDRVVVDSERTESRTSTSASSEVGGVPGTSSNLVDNTAEAGKAPLNTSTEEKSEIHRTASTTETETVKGVGDARLITVGVLVPQAKGATALDQKTLDTYRDFVMKAAGITDPKFVTVAGVVYDAAPVVPVVRWREALDLLLAHLNEVILGILAVGALVIMGRLLRRGAKPEPVGAGGVEEVVSAISRARKDLAEPLPESSPETVRYAEMEDRVREMVRKDPRISAGLVKRWLLSTK